MKAERLEGEFAPRSVSHGNPLLLRPSDALALIDRAAEEGVPILGIEGFQVLDDGVRASLDHIADFSSAVAEGHGCWQSAESFIQEHASDELVFEIVLGDDPIEAV